MQLRMFRLASPLLALLALAILPASTQAAAVPEAKVMIVGTWHFANPGLDIHNMKTDDVLRPQRQREIAEVSAALEGFRPTLVAVEAPAGAMDDSYKAWRDRKLPLEQHRNEIVQLGFRLAGHGKLDRVVGIDMPGEFPMDKVGEWAAANGKGDEFAALMQRAQAMVGADGQMLATRSIGATLRHLNRAEAIAEGQALYLELLRYGAGDVQPGAELNAAWQRRNYLICARLLQSIRPGDRVVVFYGQGHVHALQRCVIEAPGVELVQANDHLPH